MLLEPLMRQRYQHWKKIEVDDMTSKFMKLVENLSAEADQGLKSEMANIIARDIFECGNDNDRNHQTTRIQFMSKTDGVGVDETEIGMGGLAEVPLASVIARSITNMFET